MLILSYSNVITKNWLLNPTGKEDAFVEVDLVQEHLNFWIKVSLVILTHDSFRRLLIPRQKIYKADGDSHSWEWLSMVSPCVDVLRSLANRINDDLGAAQGKKHTIPDLKKDIDCLMMSLAKHEVYAVKEGRVLDFDEKPVPDVISVGLASLTSGSASNPLNEFNAAFNQIRERRRLKPVSKLKDLFSNLNLSVLAPATSSQPPQATSTATLDSAEHIGSKAAFEEEEYLEDDSDDSDEDGDENNTEFITDGPTLTREDEGDVDFDMDTVMQYIGSEEYAWEDMLDSEMESDSDGGDEQPETDKEEDKYFSN